MPRGCYQLIDKALTPFQATSPCVPWWSLQDQDLPGVCDGVAGLLPVPAARVELAGEIAHPFWL